MENESLELKIISEMVNEEVYHIEMVQIDNMIGFVAMGRTRLFFLEKRGAMQTKYEYKYHVITGVGISPTLTSFVEIHFSRERKEGCPKSWVVYSSQKLRFVEALKAQYKTYHLVEKRVLVELPLYVKQFMPPANMKLSNDCIIPPSPKISNVLLKEDPFNVVAYRGYDFTKWKHINMALNSQGNLWRSESTEKGELTNMEFQVSEKFSLVEKVSLKDFLNLEFMALEYLQSATLPNRIKPLFILKSERYLSRVNHSSEGDKSVYDGWFLRALYNDKFWNVLIRRRKYIPPDLNHWQDIVLTVVTDDKRIDEWSIKNLGDLIIPSETRETSYKDILEKYIDALRCDEEDLNYYSQVLDIYPSFQENKKKEIEKFLLYIWGIGEEDKHKKNDDPVKVIRQELYEEMYREITGVDLPSEKPVPFELCRFVSRMIQGGINPNITWDQVLSKYSDMTDVSVTRRETIKTFLLYCLSLRNHRLKIKSYLDEGIMQFMIHYTQELQNVLYYNPFVLAKMIQHGFIFDELKRENSKNFSNFARVLISNEFVQIDLKISFYKFLVVTLNEDKKGGKLREEMEKEEPYKTLLVEMCAQINTSNIILVKWIFLSLFYITNNSSSLRLYMVEETNLNAKIREFMGISSLKGSASLSPVYWDYDIIIYIVQLLRALSGSAVTKETVYASFSGLIYQIIKGDPFPAIHNISAERIQKRIEYAKLMRQVMALMSLLTDRKDILGTFLADEKEYEQAEKNMISILKRKPMRLDEEEEQSQEEEEEEEDEKLSVGQKMEDYLETSQERQGMDGDNESYKRPQVVADRLHLGSLIVEYNMILNFLQIDILQLIRKMFSESEGDYSKSKDCLGIFGVCIKNLMTCELKAENRVKLDTSLKILYDIWTKMTADHKIYQDEVKRAKLPERLRQIKSNPSLPQQFKGNVLNKILFMLAPGTGIFSKL